MSNGYINHPEYYSQFMDFKTLKDNGIFPSDLDMVYLCEDGYLVIGEIKYKGNHVQGMQAKLLTSIIDGHPEDGCLMEIEHRTKVQESKTVDVADCRVLRAYFGGKWHDYKKYDLKVLKFMMNLNIKHGGIEKI